MIRSTILAVGLLAGAPTMVSAQTPAPAAPPPAACSAAEHRQLDFWVGEWDATFTLANGQPGRAVNRITRDEYGACVITEHFYQADIDYRGHSVSMYEPRSKTWRQVWVDNQGSWISLTGGPVSGQKHIFEMVTIPNAPTAGSSRMIWEDVKPDSFTWRWQKRAADTGPWADSWVIEYTRRKPAP